MSGGNGCLQEAGLRDRRRRVVLSEQLENVVAGEVNAGGYKNRAGGASSPQFDFADLVDGRADRLCPECQSNREEGYGQSGPDSIQDRQGDLRSGFQ